MGKYRFHIPKKSLPKIEQFVKEKYPKAFSNYLVRYLFVTDYVVKGRSYYRLEVPVHTKSFSEIMGTSFKATGIIFKDLCTLGVLTKVKEAVPLMKSARYSLKDQSEINYSISFDVFSNKAITHIIKKHNTNMKNQIKFNETKGAQLLEDYISEVTIEPNFLKDIINYPLYPFLFYTPSNCTVPIGGEFEGDIMEFKMEYGNLLRIYHNDLYMKRPVDGSRIYTPFTVMHREHRKHLRYEGKTLKCVDIVASQPTLAGAFMHKYCTDRQMPVPEELARYKKICEQGKFYEEFMVGEERLPENRGAFKKEFFGSVFYTKVSKRKNKLRTRFISIFPEIHDLLDKIKIEYGNDGFANQMQILEASIMWDDVNVSLLTDGYGCYNIYDSIVSHDDDTLEEAKARIMIAFEKYDLKPTLKIEDFTKY